MKISPSSAVSGIGVATQYQIDGIAEAELKKHLNHQVELTGQIAQAAACAPETRAGFQGDAIKMLSATCGAGSSVND